VLRCGDLLANATNGVMQQISPEWVRRARDKKLHQGLAWDEDSITRAKSTQRGRLLGSLLGRV
jgi:hypothetical protein